MKISFALSTLAVALCAAQAPAFAQAKAPQADTGWYIGGSIGSSTVKAKNSGATTEDTHDTAIKIIGGYQLNNNFAIEGQYYDLGKYHGSASATYGLVTSSLTGEAKVQGLSVSAVGMYPVGSDFSLLGKLGLAEQHTTGTIAVAVSSPFGSGSASASESKTKLVPLIGLGVEYSLNKNVKLRAEYESFGKVNVAGYDIRSSLWSLGARYAF